MYMETREDGRPQRAVALVTGASRLRGIAAAIALRLAGDGWDVATSYWRPYDATMPWGSKPDDVVHLAAQLRARGAATVAVEADLADPAVPARVFDTAEAALGPITALVLAHCQSVDSGILDTTVESFDRHFAVNARATWQLIREFGLRFRGQDGRGCIISLTSDHVVGNLPYGASKGAMDRITLAAAREFAGRGITANVINPGPTDTGWMNSEQMAAFARDIPLGRVSLPEDCANLVSFLCSPQGGWMNGQLLYSNGGAQ
jgi:3-oxoacyl-[acyl-carrier protein] reductase